MFIHGKYTGLYALYQKPRLETDVEYRNNVNASKRRYAEGKKNDPGYQEIDEKTVSAEHLP